MEANARHGHSAAVPNNIFDSAALRSARMAAIDALRRDVDLVVVTGDAGCGKSVLLRMLKETLRQQHRPAWLRAGWPDAAAIHAFRTAAGRPGRAVILIEDADRFERESLRELLSVTRGSGGGQLVLAGTAALQARLSGLTRAQRTCHVQLGALMRQETELFIARRLTGKGASNIRFEHGALDRAYALSHGLPAQLEELCTCILAMRKERIDDADIARAAAYCEMARLASGAAPIAAPKPDRASELIAAALAVVIGVSLGSVVLMTTAGVPQAAERAARLIRSLHPPAASTKVAPIQLAAAAAPQDAPVAAPQPQKEPEGGVTSEPQSDTADETMPDQGGAPDASHSGTAADPLGTGPDSEPAPELALPEDEPAPPPTAEELAPATPGAPGAAAPEPAPQPAVVAPAPSPPAIAQPASPAPAPPVRSGTPDTRIVEQPPAAGAAPPSREPAGAVNPAAPTGPRPMVDTGPLMARGMALIREGDIAAARLFFERAAAQGDGKAMLALGRTYDPLELRELGVLGLKGDPQKALEWYRSAASAGDTAAQGSMVRLSEWIARTR